MKFSWKDLVAALFSFLGSLSWLYIGGFRFLTGPVKKLVVAKLEGSLTMALLIEDCLEGFLCLTLAGAIWCVWYMLESYFSRK